MGMPCETVSMRGRGCRSIADGLHSKCNPNRLIDTYCQLSGLSRLNIQKNKALIGCLVIHKIKYTHPAVLGAFRSEDVELH